MKFSCEKYMLLTAINTTARCAAAKSPIPALEGLLIQADQDVRITGYDLKRGIYTTFPANVAEKGAIVLNARLFGELIRSLPDGIVTLYAQDGMKVRIVCETSDFSIMGSSSGDYPELPSVDKENCIAVPQNILGMMIRQTSFAISDNESRPVYTGELFEVKDDTLTMVAVDGFRLALRREKVEKGQMENCSFIVPGSALSDLEKLCSETENAVEITVGAKHISFNLGDSVLISRRLEGEFLNYNRSIPTEFSTIVEINRDDLAKAVDRVALIIDERTKNPVRLSLGDDSIHISCATSIGQGEDQCPMKGSGPLEIGFNSRYLSDVLKVAPVEKLRFCFNNATSPCVITSTNDSDEFSYMILPVRLKAST